MLINLYNRWQYSLLKKALKTRRVLIVEGPRQCGKTTLIKQLEASEYIYRSLDDNKTLESALEDPHAFVSHQKKSLVIDEIQRAPKLLSAIKIEVDENQAPGRFLLAGSANILSLPSVTESLAGRVRYLRLRPLAYGEIHNNPASFLEHAFKQNLHKLSLNKDDKKSYIQYALMGGYPEARRLDFKESRLWHIDYIDTLLKRDLKEIINIKRQDSMHKLLEITAAWSSKYIQMTTIGSTLGLSRQTISSYLSALEILYLIERIPAWSTTDYDRASKRDKLFMTDTGLMASLLNWNFDKIHMEGDLTGKLIETFVFNQLAAIIDAQEERYKLYHYRDKDARELDFIIENSDGDLLGIEVKSSSSPSKDAFKHLKWFKEHQAKDRKFIGIVIYTGNDVLSYGDGFWLVPANALWAK